MHAFISSNMWGRLVVCAALGLPGACAHLPGPVARPGCAERLAQISVQGAQGLHDGACAAPLTWTAGGIDVAWEGPELRLLLGTPAGADPNDHGRFAVAVDGVMQPELRVAAAPRWVNFRAPRGVGAHTLWLRRRSEAQTGDVVLSDVATPGGKLAPPPPRPARRLLVLGDSISAGYGNLCTGPHGDRPLERQDGLRTYGALAAHTFGAEAAIMARSGIGLWRNGDGTFVDTLPERWQSSLEAVHPLPTQAVIVNLGTNDMRQPQFDDAAFVARYAAFVQALGHAYPKAHLFVAVGPMLSDTYPANERHLSRAQANAAGILAQTRAQPQLAGRVHVLRFAEQDGALGFGCDYHPSLATHRRMARDLEAALAETLGWSPF